MTGSNASFEPSVVALRVYESVTLELPPGEASFPEGLGSEGAKSPSEKQFFFFSSFSSVTCIFCIDDVSVCICYSVFC